MATDGRRITPRMMYTDGGSIPPSFNRSQASRPGAMLPPTSCMTGFLSSITANTLAGRRSASIDSARILGEMIDTVMRLGLAPMNPQARGLIEAGVRTSVARQLWDAPDRCQTRLLRFGELLREVHPFCG